MIRVHVDEIYSAAVEPGTAHCTFPDSEKWLSKNKFRIATSQK